MNRFSAQKKNWWLGVLLFCLAIGLVFISINRSNKIHIGSDFHVFWQAGKCFFEGKPLYEPVEGARPYIYPPFAAFVFQIFALCPLQISALIFFLFNVFVLLPVSLTLLWRIGTMMEFDKPRVKIALILSTVCSLKYFWSNLSMFQVNFLLFVFILLGVYFFLKAQPVRSVLVLMLATGIKLVPVLLLAFVVIRYIKNTKVILVLLLSVFLIICIPVYHYGWSVYEAYYYSFSHTAGASGNFLFVTKSNHSLMSATMKSLYGLSASTSNMEYNAILTQVVRAVLFLLVLMCGYQLWYVYARNLPKRYIVLAITCLLCVSHLLSAITWTAHLVTFMLLLLPLFCIKRSRLHGADKVVFYVLVVLSFLLAVEGSDITGKVLYTFIRTYDIFTIYLLSLFAFYTYLIYRRPVYYN